MGMMILLALIGAYKLFLEVREDDTATRDKLIRQMIEESQQERTIQFHDVGTNESTNSVLISKNGSLITFTDSVISLEEEDGFAIKCDMKEVLKLSEEKVLIGNLGVDGTLNVKSRLSIKGQAITKYWQLLGITDFSESLDATSSTLQILQASPQATLKKLSDFQEVMVGPCNLGRGSQVSFTFNKPSGVTMIKIEVTLHLFGDWFDRRVFLRIGDKAVSSVSQSRNTWQDSRSQQIIVENLSAPSSLSKKMVAVIPAYEDVMTFTLTDDSQVDSCEVSWGLISVSVFG